LKAFLDILTKNRKVQALILLLIAMVAVDTGFYFLRTVPIKSNVSDLEERIRQGRQSLRSKQGDLRLYYCFETGCSRLDEFKKLLPARTQYIEVLKKVYEMAKDDGMKTSSLGAQKKELEQEGDIVQINFTIPVSGSYKNVRKFIYDVETSPLFLNIDSLGLTSNPTTGDIALSIGLSTFMRS